jgi:hypothetical protein
MKARLGKSQVLLFVLEKNPIDKSNFMLYNVVKNLEV